MALPQPEAGAGQLLVHVKAAGVGHWDALIREGKVELQPLLLFSVPSYRQADPTIATSNECDLSRASSTTARKVAPALSKSDWNSHKFVHLLADLTFRR